MSKKSLFFRIGTQVILALIPELVSWVAGWQAGLVTGVGIEYN